MTSRLLRFTPLQRALHWIMAICILTMLFVGVGMVSTIAPKYLPLISFHKTLGILILILVLIRIVVRLRYGTPPLPADLPPLLKLGAVLSHYALYALMIVMPLLGWAMLSAARSSGAVGRPTPAADRSAGRAPSHPALGRAPLPGVRLLRRRSAARGGRPVPRPGPPGWRLRGDGSNAVS